MRWGAKGHDRRQAVSVGVRQADPDARSALILHLCFVSYHLHNLK